MQRSAVRATVRTYVRLRKVHRNELGCVPKLTLGRIRPIARFRLSLWPVDHCAFPERYSPQLLPLALCNVHKILLTRKWLGLQPKGLISGYRSPRR
jgi:hypothetical protein